MESFGLPFIELVTNNKEHAEGLPVTSRDLYQRIACRAAPYVKVAVSPCLIDCASGTYLM